MNLMEKINENIKRGIRSWLNVSPENPYVFNINEMMDFEGNAIRNRIWYRGDSNELEQFYEQNAEYADKYKFWSSKSTPGMEMRKIHTGVPALTVRTLAAVVLPDMGEFEFSSENEKQKQIWKDIAKPENNNFADKIEDAIKETLYIGDGAFKVSIDTELSKYPILEWYAGDRVEIIRKKDKVREVIFKTPYSGGGKTYVLNEIYGYGYVKNELYLDNRQVPLTTLQITDSLEDVTFDKSVMLAVPMMFYKSAKYEGRGGSIFDGKVDSYDALDEVWSQWMDALRAGRAKTYIPDCLVPRDPKTGAAITPNPFDNRYFAAEGDQREGQKNVISTDQPSIPHDSYQASYCTALDLCLQGIISPSTLGIDVKKLDNAEAQREKEKTTLYTRNIIVETLQTVLPQVVSMCINAYHLMKNEAVESVEVNLPFGEYANPSFESQVETVGKAKQSGIMSIERCVEELYGDSLDDDCKKEEIARLKAEQGIQSIPEPEIRTDAGEFRINGFTGGSDGSKSSEKNIPDEPGGIPGAPEGGQ